MSLMFEKEEEKAPEIEEPQSENEYCWKVHQENIKYFLNELQTIKWDNPEDAEKEIKKLLRVIDKKYFTHFEKKLASSLVPELKKQKEKLNFDEKPSFLKNTCIADASFLTNYQKLSKFIKDHEDLKKSNDFMNFEPQNTKVGSKNPFEAHLTLKNMNDVHANSKRFFPFHKDMQFTDFGEINKEKSNANKFVLQQNWPLFERNIETFPERTPEKNIYPGPIIKNEVLGDFLQTEVRLKDSQKDRLKQNIEALGGIEDTISIMNKTFQKKENDLKLDLNPNLNFITNSNSEIKKLNNTSTDPFNYDPLYFGKNMNLVERTGIYNSGEEEMEKMSTPLEKSVQKGPKNEEGLRILKISKELRREKEEWFFDRKSLV